tara:strand:- start:4195 stop:5052 length:858 start_codon:yes stop_codon:yes gene_type:complete
MIKKINYFFQAIVIFLFFIVGRILGLRMSRKIFSLLFSMLGPYIKSKKIINNNLNKFSKDISIKEKDFIVKEMWKNYGKTFIEYIYLDYFRKIKTHIQIEGEENIDDVINFKKPVIFVSGHFANFELMSMEITKKNIPLATIYRPLNNNFLNPFMEYLRKKYICKNQIEKGIKGVREAIEFIKNKYSIALMIDQRVSEGEKIDFFGYPAFTSTLPAQLAYKFDLYIIPVSIQRLKNNDFKIEFHKKINPSEYNDKIHLTNKLNTILEKMIEKNPSQWIWTHNRWK